jgi:hypothetical protein
MVECNRGLHGKSAMQTGVPEKIYVRTRSFQKKCVGALIQRVNIIIFSLISEMQYIYYH